MINYEAINAAALEVTPYKYAHIKNFLNANDADELREKLPLLNYYRSVRTSGSDKTYNVLNNILFKLDQDTNETDGLPEQWREFVTKLTDDKYKQALAALLKEDLSNCFQEITLKIYEPGDFLSFHTDRPDVKATHMIFLNDLWKDEWGGQLVFAEAIDATPFKVFNPLWSDSVAFVRADNSWHGVPEIKTNERKRIALQVAFWNIKSRNVLPGRIEQGVDYYD